MTREFNYTEPPKDLKQAVGEALGAASVAWEGSPTGVFQDDFALDIHKKLIAYIEEHYERKSEPDREWMWRLVKWNNESAATLELAPEFEEWSAAETSLLVQRIGGGLMQVGARLAQSRIESDEDDDEGWDA
jgi:hypothetical protein